MIIKQQVRPVQADIIKLTVLFQLSTQFIRQMFQHIVQTVNAIVKEGMSASDALRTLMDRNRKNEMPQGYEKV